jgi:hypothetical protein
MRDTLEIVKDALSTAVGRYELLGWYELPEPDEEAQGAFEAFEAVQEAYEEGRVLLGPLLEQAAGALETALNRCGMISFVDDSDDDEDSDEADEADARELQDALDEDGEVIEAALQEIDAALLLTRARFMEAREIGRVWGADRARYAPDWRAFLLDDVMAGSAYPILGVPFDPAWREGRTPMREAARSIAHVICRAAGRELRRLRAGSH